MKRLILVFCALIIVISLAAQDKLCGTKVSGEQLKFMNSIHSNLPLRSLRSRTSLSRVEVPIKFHIVRTSSGTGGLNHIRVNSLLNEVNAVYEGAQIEFVQVGDINFIDNDSFFNFDSSEENQMAGTNDVNGVINIYIPGTVSSGESALCGYTRFPPSSDRVFVASGCADTEFGTTAHELGHYFTLFHTHGKTNTGTTDELVARVNCEVLGDNICDTPADPNLTGRMSGCDYTGDVRDANGDLFVPNPRNIMSYAPNSCRDFFSTGQLSRIRNGLEGGRSYLNINFLEFRARLNTDITTGCAPLTIRFEDVTSGGASRTWLFEGATNINESTARNVTVVYNDPGIYEVTLIAENSSGQLAETTRSNFIIVQDPLEDVIDQREDAMFDDPALPSTWDINNDDRLQTWEYSSVSSENSTSGSYFVNNFEYDASTVPQVDDLELSSFDLRDTKSISISFDYAYAFRSPQDIQFSNVYDTMEIGYTVDCEDEFISLIKIGGAELSTLNGEGVVNTFVPEQSQWSTISRTINKSDLPGSASLLSFSPVIRNNCYNGNNLYIDDVILDPDFSLDSLEFFRLSQEDGDTFVRWFNPSINSRGVIFEARAIDGSWMVLDTVDINSGSRYQIPIELLDSPNLIRARNYNRITVSAYTPEISTIIPLYAIDSKHEPIIYPNPIEAGDLIFIGQTKEFGILSIRILSSTGQMIRQYGKVELIDSSDLSTGIFFVQLVTNEEIITRKILIR